MLAGGDSACRRGRAGGQPRRLLRLASSRRACEGRPVSMTLYSKRVMVTPPFSVIVAWPRRRRVGESAYPGSAVPARTWQLPLVPNHDHFPSHARARSDPRGGIHPFDAAILMAPGRGPTSPPRTRSSRGSPPPRGDRNDGGLSGPGIRALTPTTYSRAHARTRWKPFGAVTVASETVLVYRACRWCWRWGGRGVVRAPSGRQRRRRRRRRSWRCGSRRRRLARRGGRGSARNERRASGRAGGVRGECEGGADGGVAWAAPGPGDSTGRAPAEAGRVQRRVDAADHRDAERRRRAGGSRR